MTVGSSDSWSPDKIARQMEYSKPLYKNEIPGPSGKIFSEAHQNYKNNLVIFLHIAGPDGTVFCHR